MVSHQSDITQHIISAGRGNLGDLATALNDLYERIVDENSRLVEATVAQVRSATASVSLTPANLIASQAPVVLTDGASVAVNMALGNVFILTFDGNRTIANPTNHVIGMGGEFWLYNFSGGNELTWDTFYDFVGTPTTAQGINALSCVRYRVVAAESILCTMKNT